MVGARLTILSYMSASGVTIYIVEAGFIEGCAVCSYGMLLKLPATICVCMPPSRWKQLQLVAATASRPVLFIMCDWLGILERETV